MKKYLLFATMVVLVCGLYGFTKMETAYSNIFTQLGLGKEEADSYILGNITGYGTSFPKTRIMTSLALNKREEAIQEIGKYIKAYVQNPEFKAEYDNIRTEMKPEKPPVDDKEAMDWYKTDLKRWEESYPATINALLKHKLNNFLEITASVDYAAKLKREGSKMIFVDRDLEEKDEFWKACYRAGKPTVNAARSFAQQWLKEL